MMFLTTQNMNGSKHVHHLNEVSSAPLACLKAGYVGRFLFMSFKVADWNCLNLLFMSMFHANKLSSLVIAY